MPEQTKTISLNLTILLILVIGVIVLFIFTSLLYLMVQDLKKEIDIVKKNESIVATVLTIHDNNILNLNNTTNNQIRFNTNVEIWANSIEERLRTNISP